MRKSNRLLVACEFSGVVRRAFRAVGADAWSCDLLPSEDDSPYHIQADVFEVLENEWDCMIAHPPCTHLTVAGARWFKGKEKEQQDAILFVERLYTANIPKIVIENPVGVLSTKSILGKPDHIIQPYMFGEDASKKTCLWLKGLKKLKMPAPATWFPPREVLYKGSLCKRWSNQTDSGQNRLGPSEDRWKDRSRTYEGFARAWAEEWYNKEREEFG